MFKETGNMTDYKDKDTIERDADDSDIGVTILEIENN